MDAAQPQPVFPPPTIPSVPQIAQVAQIAQIAQIELEPTPPPKRRRTGLLVGVGAVVVAAVVAVVVLLGGGSSDATYSLKAATKGAAEARNVAFEMTMSAGPVQMTMTARVDVAAELTAMKAELPALADVVVDAIIDTGNQVMYMDASAFPGAEQLATPWISMDLSKVPGAAESFGATAVNPLDAAALFEDAATVVDKGVEEVNGEQVKHYVVTVDLAEAMAAQPGMFDQIDALGGDLPDTLDYDVWVTEDNQMRRLSFGMDVAGQTVSMDMTVTAIGTIDPIVIPADDDVTDITDMLPAG